MYSAAILEYLTAEVSRYLVTRKYLNLLDLYTQGVRVGRKLLKRPEGEENHTSSLAASYQG